MSCNVSVMRRKAVSITPHSATLGVTAVWWVLGVKNCYLSNMYPCSYLQVISLPCVMKYAQEYPCMDTWILLLWQFTKLKTGPSPLQRVICAWILGYYCFGNSQLKTGPSTLHSSAHSAPHNAAKTLLLTMHPY